MNYIKLLILLTSINNLFAKNIWISKCQKLPTLNSLVNNQKIFFNPSNFGPIDKNKKLDTSINFQEFNQTLDNYFNSINTSSLANTDLWINFKNNCLQNIYLQKLIVSDKNVIYMHGDLHGDIHSLVKFLISIDYAFYKDSFKLKDKNVRIIFLGDYTDKGIYGLEVIQTLLYLKIENPDQVFFVRGNHETPEINQNYNFASEFLQKFAIINQHNKEICFSKIINFYKTLPVAIYLGCNNNFIQCCHGGIEIGYTPEKLLGDKNKIYEHVDTFYREKNCCYLSQISNCSVSSQNLINYIKKPNFKANMPLDNGFMWSDFDPIAQNNLSITPGRGIMYDKQTTGNYLKICSGENYKLCGIFRAHQHSASNSDLLMNQMLKSYGVARLWNNNFSKRFKPWNGIVCTFLVSPDTLFGLKTNLFDGIKYDTFAIINPADKFEEWEISTVNTKTL